MLIRLRRQEFLAELIPMLGIVERRSTIPVLSHLLLRADGESLHLAATDLDVSLTSRVTGEVQREGALAVQALKFVEIVRSLPDADLDLEVEGENRLQIRSGPSRFKLVGLAAEDFPTLPGVEGDGEVGIPFAMLKRMVGQILFAVSTEESRFQLNGALLEPRDGAFALVATDGYRLALVENPLEGMQAGDGVLVPRKALNELLRLDFAGEVLFRRGGHHLGFGLGQRQLSCRILEGSFPDYQRVISTDNPHQAVFDRRLLHDAVQRVALMTGDRAAGIRMEVASGQATVSTANPDLGEASEAIVSEYEGESLVLGVNPGYMLQFLAACDTEKVRFELKDEASQAVGFPVEGQDARYLCVIMPMRV